MEDLRALHECVYLRILVFALDLGESLEVFMERFAFSGDFEVHAYSMHAHTFLRIS